MNIDPLVLSVGVALVFSAGAYAGAWYVLRPIRKREREVDEAEFSEPDDNQQAAKGEV